MQMPIKHCWVHQGPGLWLYILCLLTSIYFVLNYYETIWILNYINLGFGRGHQGPELWLYILCLLTSINFVLNYYETILNWTLNWINLGLGQGYQGPGLWLHILRLLTSIYFVLNFCETIWILNYTNLGFGQVHSRPWIVIAHSLFINFNQLTLTCWWFNHMTAFLLILQ